MPFERWGYNFRGPYASYKPLQPMPGVYVIWCRDKESWTVLDVGEAADVKERVGRHERTSCWQQNCPGIIYYSATYTPTLQQAERVKIEQKIRDLTKPICGVG